MSRLLPECFTKYQTQLEENNEMNKFGDTSKMEQVILIDIAI